MIGQGRMVKMNLQKNSVSIAVLLSTIPALIATILIIVNYLKLWIFLLLSLVVIEMFYFVFLKDRRDKTWWDCKLAAIIAGGFIGLMEVAIFIFMFMIFMKLSNSGVFLWMRYNVGIVLAIIITIAAYLGINYLISKGVR